MAQAPAGWYPQPDGTQRYWDGSQWTEHISGTPAAPAAAAPAAAAAAEAPAPKAKAPAKPKTKAAAAAAAEASEPVVIASSDNPPGATEIAQPTPIAVPVGAPSDLGATVPRKRKVWPIVVGVIGALVLIVIIVIVALVLILRNAVSGPNEAVMNYDAAWQEVDCALMQDSTTQSFQDNNGFVDCATFEQVAQPFADSLGSYTVTITSTQIQNDTATVLTTERWVGTEGDESTYEYEYQLVKVDGAWLIDTLGDPSA